MIMDIEYNMTSLLLFLMWTKHNEQSEKKKGWLEWLLG